MFFRKKKKDRGPVPVMEVERMISSGMSDKDIIKNLKDKGFSYESIERAMLQAVKAGVGEEKPAPKPQMTEVREQGGASTIEEVYGKEPETIAATKMPPEVFPSTPPKLEPKPEEAIPEEFAEDLPSPDVIVEELVEGVVEEKWQRFKDRLDKLEDEFEKIRAGEKQLGERINAEAEHVPSGEFESRFTEMSSQLEDLEVRIGGLERAFKQFLPSLTRNIENLSEIIHQMKRKHGLEEEL